jgi:hypothetical protein
LKKYTHYFDVRLSQRIESDIEDFDDALKNWISSFASTQELRTALLTTHQDTASLMQGILHSDSWINESSTPPAPDGASQ